MNENFYKELIKESPTGYAYHKIICDKEGQPCDYEFLEVNAAFEKLTGLKSSDIIGKRVTDVLPDIKNGEFNWIRYYGDIALNGSKIEFEQHSSSLGKWYRINVYSPQKGYFITHFIDVTKEREQMQELDNFFRINLDLLSIADTDGTFLKLNKEWEETLGYTIDELEKRKLLDFVHPDDVDSTREAMAQLEKQEQVLSFVNRYRCKDGSYRFIEWRSQPHNGNLVYSAARDITERISKENVLTKMVHFSEDFLQSHGKDLDYLKITEELLEISGAKLAVFNLYEEDGKRYTTKAIAGDKGVIAKATKMVGLKNGQWKWDPDLVRAKKIEKNTITRFPSLGELVGDVLPKAAVSVITKSFGIGEVVVVKITQNDIMLGDFTLFMAKGQSFTRDSLAEVYTRQLGMVITQKRTERLLHEERERMVNILEGTDVATWEWNVETGSLVVNERWAEMIGYTVFEIAPVTIDTWRKFTHPEDLIKAEALLAKVFAKKTDYYDFERRMKHQNGRWIWVQDRGKVISWTSSGKPLLMSGTHTNISKRKLSEEKVRDKQKLNEQLLSSLPHPALLIDVRDKKVVVANKAALQYGLKVGGHCWRDLYKEESLSKKDKDIVRKYSDIVPAELGIKCVWCKGDECITEGEEQRELIKAFDRYFDTYWIKVSDTLYLHYGIDITERKEMEDQIKQYQDIANNMQVGLHVYHLEDPDDDTTLRMVATNPAAALHTGLSEEEVLGKTLDESFPNLRGTNHPQRYAEVARSGKALEIEDIYYSDDRIVEAAFAVKVFPLPNNCVGVIFENITKRKQAEEEIAYLSYHDQLTGLYNRRFFEEEMKRLNTKRNLPLSILMGDVNGLKLVNDSFGHSLGDELLKKAAEAIKKGCREDDIIARLGGDEFVILLPNTDAKKAESVIKRIIKQAQKDKVGPIDLSISFGYDTLTSAEDSIHDTLKNAENRMYTHKLYMGSSMRSKTVDLIMNTLYEKSNREQMHSTRVSKICEAIATKMNFEKDEVNTIRIAGLMHDIGKIGVADEVLNKAEKLNDDEWEEIKRHSEIGYRILSSVNEFSDIAKYILEHHERWDGKGYPRGLRGEEISLQPRIIALADAFDAMTSSRPYRKALSEEEALSEIRRFSYTQFDPAIAKIFVEEVCGKSGFFEKEKRAIN